MNGHLYTGLTGNLTVLVRHHEAPMKSACLPRHNCGSGRESAATETDHVSQLIIGIQSPTW